MSVELMPRTRALEPLRERVPPLENGDRLTRQEFHRRYEEMPENVRAELIEGVVFMSSPARHVPHAKPQGSIVAWLGVYVAETPHVELGDNGSVLLDTDNEFQPDAYLRLEPDDGGNSRLNEDGYIEGAPELVVEVAASTVSRDLHQKLHVYRRTGVQEYLVWRTQDKALDWFRLREGKYERVEPDAEGIIRSEIFPGLRMAVDKMLSGDLAGVLAELQKGIASEEHQKFVEKLQTNVVK